jgi:uncharacterized protein YecE (DUF72 family)
MALWIGTSGWQYDDWRERFYPPRLPTSRWLDHYAERFDTVELNVTFYRQPRPAVFDGWAARVPDGFRFAVKASRYLTHVRRLRRPRESVEYLLEGASRLGTHLGPVLLQLPPSLEAAPDALAEALSAFPASIRLAVEPRHRSWESDEVRAVLEARGAALCWADRRRPLGPTWRTADWGYLRLHEGRAAPRPCYGRRALDGWIGRIAAAWPPEADVYAYFNNDPLGCAVRDGAVFGRLAARRGLRPTRTPAASGITVG